MRIVFYSDYLHRREKSLRQESQEALSEPLQGPSGALRLLIWMVSRDAFKQRRVRRHRARGKVNEAGNYAKGRAGEDALMQLLASRLDNQYLLIRNYELPPPWQVGGDLDAILIGPHGITVFEVKAWSGWYRFSGDQWEYRDARRGWIPAFTNPSAQAQRNAQRLHTFLSEAGLGDILVQPVVVISGKDVRVDLNPPLSTYVFFPSRRGVTLGWLAEPRVPSPVLEAVEDALLAQVTLGAE